VLEIRWVDPAGARGATGRRCAAFFAAHVDAAYLSPADAAAGRIGPDSGLHPDLEAIVAAELAASTGAPGAGDGGHLAVVFEGDSIVGIAIVAHDAGSTVAVIDDVLVAPGSRGTGLGRRFVRWIEAELASVGVREIHLETSANNPRARALFESMGFAPVAVHLTRRISPDTA
jgi:GNAT superfamily N-acetyltransferase